MPASLLSSLKHLGQAKVLAGGSGSGKPVQSLAGSNIEYGGYEPSVNNVVFVHGSIDPWHAMGVLEDLHEGAPSIYITGTSHCADMYEAKESDPEELTAARIRIGNLVKSWVQNAKK